MFEYDKEYFEGFLIDDKTSLLRPGHFIIFTSLTDGSVLGYSGDIANFDDICYSRNCYASLYISDIVDGSELPGSSFDESFLLEDGLVLSNDESEIFEMVIYEVFDTARSRVAEKVIELLFNMYIAKDIPRKEFITLCQMVRIFGGLLAKFEDLYFSGTSTAIDVGFDLLSTLWHSGVSHYRFYPHSILKGDLDEYGEYIEKEEDIEE